MPPADVAALGTILSIWAHPDDETYLAGGLMAAAAAQGQRVVCVSATAGEQGSDDPSWPPSRLGPIRRLEAAAAMAVLGVAEHHVLGFPDGGLAGCDDVGVEAVGRFLTQVRPDTIVTFGSDGITGHTDHVAVHRWVATAWRAVGRPGRLLTATWTSEHLARFGEDYEGGGVYMSDDRVVGVPERDLAVHLCLDAAAVDRKVVALRAMATQTGPQVAALGVDRFAASVAEECFVELR